ncbi:MAG TPA: cytidine deaminase [Ferruginibacter sp.]|jgi:cytidine deaminase|nr:cytidine deaminase [Ferruginibacter sp.]
MKKKEYHFAFEVYELINELSKADAELLRTARTATKNSYAPYSNFNVAAVALLSNGEIITGTNQENASYPVGICAERVLLSIVGSLHPSATINTIAIAYNNLNGESNKPISPCGMCRQAFTEYETRTSQSFRLLLSGMEGEVYLIDKASQLMPLSFSL